MVVIEFVTGCLHNGQKGDFYDCYIDECDAVSLEAAIPKLLEDADPLAEEWEEGILASVCSLAIRCIQNKEAKDL